jgi:hypothetical protein
VCTLEALDEGPERFAGDRPFRDLDRTRLRRPGSMFSSSNQAWACSVSSPRTLAMSSADSDVTLVIWVRMKSLRMSVMSRPSADWAPGVSGTTMRVMPSSAARREAWSGPAPPNGTST